MKKVLLLLTLLIGVSGISQNASYFKRGVRLGEQTTPSNPRDGQLWFDGSNIFMYEESAASWFAVTNQSSGGSPTGLESIDEGNGFGWRLIGRDPNNYGNVGLNAIDFSTSNNSDTTLGATGSNSFAWGDRVFATGNFSMVMGNAFARAAGSNSFVIGDGTANAGFSGVIRAGVTNGFESLAILSGVTNPSAQRSLAMNGGNTSGVESMASGRGVNTWSYREVVLGSSNENRSGNNTSWVSTDPILVVGNGQNSANRSDAFTIYKNGIVQLHAIPLSSISSPVEGGIILDSEESNKIKIYLNGAWLEFTTVAD